MTENHAAADAAKSHQANVDAAKKKATEEREAREKVQGEQREAMAKGKPTPTQDENDRAALGEHIAEHDPDGSGPDPHMTRQVEAKPGGSGGAYPTRASTAAPSSSHQTASPSPTHQPRRHGDT